MNTDDRWDAVPPGGGDVVCLRENPLDDDGNSADGEDDILEKLPAETDSDEVDPEAVILCRRCGHLITRPTERMQIHGGHHHTFANPSGRVFEIGCFRQAEGCGPSGEATDEFTWFRGYRWRLALCRACFVHLGWQFTANSGSSGFWGLIINRLAFPL